ncbi:MAG: histidinol dehydrogenase [Marinilabiliales bacterium]|nr:MAG: histidinol dehydrogenase [Marinilabiliales bacterium]
MEIFINPPFGQWEELCRRPHIDNSKLEKDVRDIMDMVKREGDDALKKFSRQFDGAEVSDLRVADEEIRKSADLLDGRLKDAIKLAAGNIEAFHRAQKPAEVKVTTMPGVECTMKYLPIEKVGLYIPGGTAPLFSTVLMLAIPAHIAGCREVIICTPPGGNGEIHPAILYAASISNVTTVYRTGGAQAVAAMAWGTETIPRVDKIFGPGNQWVTMAKQIATSYGVAIDLPAGPSEVAVIADNTVPSSFVAADLLSQAEHGEDSQVMLLTTDNTIIEKVKIEIERLMNRLPRRDIASEALKYCRILLFDTYDELMDFTNAYAPEHLIIATENYNELADRVLNAGSVFLGNYTPESAGDYASGTNHTLPTNGFARAWSGVGTGAFMKRTSFQEITPDGIRALGPVIEFMAQAEELEAHRQAVKVRLDYLMNKTNESWNQSIH